MLTIFKAIFYIPPVKPAYFLNDGQAQSATAVVGRHP